MFKAKETVIHSTIQIEHNTNSIILNKDTMFKVNETVIQSTTQIIHNTN